MNDTQRHIVGASILVVGIALVASIASNVEYSDGPLDFEQAGLVWIIGLPVIGAIEYYLYDN